MRLVMVGVLVITAFIGGALCARYLDGRREQAFLAEAQDKCLPRPGERTWSVNDNGTVTCDRQKVLKHPALRWPYGR